MNQNVAALIENLSVIQKQDCAFTERLGLDYALTDFQKRKDTIVGVLLQYSSTLNGVYDSLPSAAATELFAKLSNFTERLKNLCDQVSGLVEANRGRDFSQIQSRKSSLTGSADTLYQEILAYEPMAGIITGLGTASQLACSAASPERVNQLEQLKAELNQSIEKSRGATTEAHEALTLANDTTRKAHEEMTAQFQSALGRLVEQSGNSFKEIREKSDEIEQLIHVFRDAAAEKNRQILESSYSGLSTAHCRREWWWFVGLMISVVALLAAVSVAILKDFQVTSGPEVALLISKKVLGLSTALLLLRVCLTKYNSERHLRILYDHRTAAVIQLGLMEAQLGNDEKTKAQLRVAAVNMILSDPETGYCKSNEGSDLNITPVMNIAEKMAGAGK